MQIRREFSATRDVITLDRGTVCERYVSARNPGGDNLAVFRQPPAPGTPVTQLVFGGRRFAAEADALAGPVTWPLTWVHGDSCSGADVAGTQIQTVSGAAVRRIEQDGRTVAAVYEDEDARYCRLGGILPADPKADRRPQTRSVFERLEAALVAANMDFSHIVRTWLYLDDLLTWYADFNAVRTAFFEQRGVFDRLLPASTGIGGGNPADAALMAGALAIEPKHPGLEFVSVPSPLQCPATNYRSSFSRAVELRFPTWRQLIVSGSASISPDGKTAHVGDIDRQIALTMEVIGAILTSRGYGWEDTLRLVAYFQDMRHAPRFTDYCRQHRLPPLPVVPAHAMVCRPDLLFEVEMDAIRPV